MNNAIKCAPYGAMLSFVFRMVRKLVIKPSSKCGNENCRMSVETSSNHIKFLAFDSVFLMCSPY